jgi:hypothetical protein
VENLALPVAAMVMVSLGQQGLTYIMEAYREFGMFWNLKAGWLLATDRQ